MRSFFLCLVALAFLYGCQTTVQKPLADVQPVVGSITIGSYPIRNAIQTATNRFTVREGSQSGYVEMSAISRIDADLSKDAMKMRMEVLEADMDVVNLTGFDSATSSEFEQLEGTVIEMVFNRKERNISGKIRSPGMDRSETFNSDRMGREKKQYQAFVKLLMENTLNGKTVRQGQEVMSFDLADVMQLKQDQRIALSGRVVGQSVYAGRPVIVVKAIGDFVEDDRPILADSISYVDTFTGVSLYSTLALSGFDKKGTEFEVLTKQTVDLDGGAQ